MLTAGTHKIYKITSLTTDSYKQLFVLITMLLTVLSVQQSTTFAMAAPLEQPFVAASALASSPPAAAATPAYQQQQHNLLQHHPPRTHHHRHRQRHQLLQQQQFQQHQQQHPETQLNFLLAENDHHHHHHHQSETDIDTEERLLHKRHTSWHDYYAKTMDSKKIEWHNPCGGHYINIEKKQKAKTKPAIKKTLRALQNATVREFNSLNANELHSIDIRNMSIWDKFDEHYKFLPNLKTNSKISLRRWYRQLQIYVGAFDYLHRAQLHWDYHKAMQKSETSRELYLLRNNAREILCNIENAINKTTVYSKAKRTIDSLIISREKMESILHFYTDLQHISPLKWDQMKNDNTLYHINPVELRVAKSHYLRYIRTFIKILRVTTKRPGPIHLGRRAQKKVQEKQQGDNPSQGKPKKQSRRTKTKATPINLE